MSRVSWYLDKRILVHLARAADQEEDIEEMGAEVDIVVDHRQDQVEDTEEALALEDQVEDTMVKAEKVDHHLVDTHLLVVMTMEVEDTEVDRPQVLVEDTEVDHHQVAHQEDLDTVVLRVEATEVTHSVIVDHLLDTASHDHLSLEEMHLTMHTHSEESSIFVHKKNSERSSFLLFDHSLCSQYPQEVSSEWIVI
jgi:hypothetical protein